MKLAIALSISVLSSACLSTTPSVVATGEPLEARGHMRTVRAHFDDDLDWIPEHEVFVFDGHFQGDTQIDELDFYHLAGDTDAVEGLATWRGRRNLGSAASWIATIACLGAVAAGAGLYSQSGSETPDDLSMGLMTGGSIGLGISLFLVPRLFFPSETLNQFGFLYDYERASAAAGRSTASSE